MATKTTKSSTPAAAGKSPVPANKAPSRADKPAGRNAPAAKRPAPKAAPKRAKTKSRHGRVVPISLEERRLRLRSTESQFAYMKEPGAEHAFEVGNTVEVFCDHERNNERIREWVRGIVVQVDNKMVAVQFRLNVFLTDGWMVPDRILWYPLTSDQIRVVGAKKAVKKDFIPEY
ncbi:MAG: hypothetical protein HFACDABA_00292 [Anaerolineales bacterium]|nr:hypothetical protein [Anaerolineales bacterium]